MNAGPDRAAPPASPQLPDLEVALFEGLSEHLPGLEILDRTLVLSGGAEGRALRADLVAIDACGRLAMISLVDGQADETVFTGLESVGLLRSSGSLLAQYWRTPRISARAQGLVVLVAEVFSERVLRALSAVSPRELRLFEMRELSSAEGGRSILVGVGGASSVRDDRSAVSRFAEPERADFLELVPAAQRATAEMCLERIDRIDADLDSRASLDMVGWRFRGRNLCCVAWNGEHLLGVVAPREAAFHLHQAVDVHRFVDRVVREHVRRLSREDADGEAAEDRSGAARGMDESSDVEALSGVLLTPEEIAAFRD